MLAQDKIVACSRPQSVGSDHGSSMASLTNDVMNSGSNLQCSYCNFRCDASHAMAQHSWEQHPLSMRRKKHLISSPKRNAITSSSSDDTTSYTPKSFVTTTPPLVNQTAEEMQNCKLSGCSVNKELGVTTPACPGLQRNQQEAITYRNNAMRSLSLLSTAAAIVEGQANASPQRHIAIVKPQPVETQLVSRAFPVFEAQQMCAPTYNAYIPSLNQYVAIAVSPASVIPHPALLNTSLENARSVYLNTQQLQDTQFPPQLAPSHSYLAHKSPAMQTQPSLGVQKSVKQATDEIRSLLQTNKSQVGKVAPLSTPTIQPVPMLTKVNKAESLNHFPTSSTPFPRPILDEERVQALEKALFSTDCCDINDSSTTMPFKCADGVWRMVKFKCIKGLWVVQTPDSSTPTVYVPYDDEIFPGETDSTRARKTFRSLSETSGHKRKLSVGDGSYVDAKRLCSSAPVTSNQGENLPGSGISLNRTLSHPFITKRLPPPSQYFTNNEGKRVNISVIKRNYPQSSSCSLIKSLLLRKSIHSKPALASSQTSGSASSSFTSSSGNSSSDLRCKSAPERQLAATMTLAKPLLKSAMVY